MYPRTASAYRAHDLQDDASRSDKRAGQTYPHTVRKNNARQANWLLTQPAQPLIVLRFFRRCLGTMPTYEYECHRCGHAFEKFHSISAPPPKRCPKCRGKVRRRIGMGAGLLFKGSGFYITDYRSEGYKKASKDEQSGATPATTKEKSEKPVSKEASSPKKSATS